MFTERLVRTGWERILQERRLATGTRSFRYSKNDGTVPGIEFQENLSF